ncbi:uncharacterized protein MELLADRAFT_55948 [Melampsora larici-populina 98AG31]|uniref:Uncharacterized protein n=1 Tax=Melampsora larici-populina (strain 98AG31 / pathotype 3-4-7) TaxID=747676 RepID=F4RK74_MELLP|nr:uncharacterized protein MELLADRAFT_55948 [Melampsora larici-populina 98AG31]EGG07049.1 hypothetical protein MELLADRAFT_55948 [Melampsora larici-populina 98AG31]
MFGHRIPVEFAPRAAYGFVAGSVFRCSSSEYESPNTTTLEYTTFGLLKCSAAYILREGRCSIEPNIYIISVPKRG